MRMIFKASSGIYMNIDKIIHNMTKIVPGDEFSAYVVSLNDHIFRKEISEQKESEDIIFARTCHKIIETGSQP